MNSDPFEEGPFPYHLVEVLNGVLFVVLFWMLVFLVMHLWRLWKDIRGKYYGRWGVWRAAKRTYTDCKPEIALLVIVMAFCIRTFVLWYVRWYKHDGDIENIFTRYSGELLTGFTLVLVIGVACWIRVISPLSGRWAVLMWFLMVLSSVVFGVGMHYAF